jgi:hypothetical protein
MAGHIGMGTHYIIQTFAPHPKKKKRKKKKIMSKQIGTKSENIPAAFPSACSGFLGLVWFISPASTGLDGWRLASIEERYPQDSDLSLFLLFLSFVWAPMGDAIYGFFFLSSTCVVYTSI